MQSAQVIPFDFEKRPVRVTVIDGNPWFVATDICKALGIANTTQALQSLDEDERSMFNIGRQGDVNIINESGLFTLILRSRDATKPGTPQHRFRKWVTAEVLPTIRKHGRYEDTSGKMDTLLNSTIGTDGFHCLAAVLDGKVRHLPKKRHTGLKNHVWSQVRKAFSVSHIPNIPAAQLADARNFIAAYVVPLEGELIEKEPEPKPVDTLLPEAQAKEINDRLNRLFGLFHPFSDQFGDVQGIQRALRGCHPKWGIEEPTFRQVLKRIA